MCASMIRHDELHKQSSVSISFNQHITRPGCFILIQSSRLESSSTIRSMNEESNLKQLKISLLVCQSIPSDKQGY